MASRSRSALGGGGWSLGTTRRPARRRSDIRLSTRGRFGCGALVAAVGRDGGAGRGGICVKRNRRPLGSWSPLRGALGSVWRLRAGRRRGCRFGQGGRLSFLDRV